MRAAEEGLAPEATPRGGSRGRAPRLGGLGVVLLLAPLLVAPSPGNTGGCGEVLETANAEQYCWDRYSYECLRLDLRGAYPTADFGSYEDCMAYRDINCPSPSRASWPPSTCTPPPTIYDADACIDALSRAENLSIPIEDLAECDVTECGQR